MKKIWKNKSWNSLNLKHKKQFMNFMFGEDFMESEDKGRLKIKKGV